MPPKGTKRPLGNAATTTSSRPLVDAELETGEEETAGSVIVMISRSGGREAIPDAPQVTVFTNEASFRKHVLHALLGDVEQCRAMARSFRRMEAAMDAGHLQQACNMSPKERFFIQGLVHA
jgi:hypothetical protein